MNRQERQLSYFNESMRSILREVEKLENNLVEEFVKVQSHE